MCAIIRVVRRLTVLSLSVRSKPTKNISKEEKTMKKILALFLAVLMLVSMTGSVQAASGDPYKDVTKKAVGADAYKAIKALKGWGAYSKDFAIQKGKFQPTRKITRGEFLAMLGNLYGDDKVPVDMADVRKAGSTATAKWACKKMVQLADRLDVRLSWSGDSTKMSRALASRYAYILCTFCEELKLHK